MKQETPSNVACGGMPNSATNAEGICTGDHKRTDTKAWKEIHICIYGPIQSLAGIDGRIQRASNKALIPERGKSLENRIKH